MMLTLDSDGTEKGGELHVTGLTKKYAGVTALESLDLTVAVGEVVGLIGPNGSGKSTALDCISGVQRPDSGSVQFAGRNVGRSSLHSLANRGVTRTFQAVRIFPSLSIRDNLLVAAVSQKGRGPGYYQYLKSRLKWPDAQQQVQGVIEELDLTHVAELQAGHLSYGQRKLVELGSALVMKPSIMLLDEPVAAVNPTLANVIRDHIKLLNDKGISILLVEHNIELVVGLCTRLIVLDNGVKIAEGEPREIINNPSVQEAYFGR